MYSPGTCSCSSRDNLVEQTFVSTAGGSSLTDVETSDVWTIEGRITYRHRMPRDRKYDDRINDSKKPSRAGAGAGAGCRLSPGPNRVRSRSSGQRSPIPDFRVSRSIDSGSSLALSSVIFG